MRKDNFMLTICLVLVLTVCFSQTGSAGVKSVNVTTSPTKRADESTATSLAASKNILVDISWKFEVKNKTDVNGVDVPEADVSVVINNEAFKVGRYPGFPREVRNLSKAGMPRDAILACKTWFGGAGEDFYIKKKNDTSLVVFHRHVDEADPTLGSFEKIKEINFTGKIEVRILKQR